jgi:hypothetical protein
VNWLPAIEGVDYTTVYTQRVEPSRAERSVLLTIPRPSAFWRLRGG